jgi:hypothetical protein
MIPGLSDLEGSALAKVLRRTVVSSLIVGGGGIVVTLLLSFPWAALGIVVGLGMAIVNLRFLDAGWPKCRPMVRLIARRCAGPSVPRA